MSERAAIAAESLETIRGLMERAREYRHPPAPVGFIAGLGAVGAGAFTHLQLAEASPDFTKLGLAWGGLFAVAFVTVVLFTIREARREGIAFWSPLARDVVHALWPSLLGALALTVALVRAGHFELVAPLWLVAYGAGGIAAGSFASPIVRVLGVAFLALGIADTFVGWPPGIVLAIGFGGMHLIYGAVVAFKR